MSHMSREQQSNFTTTSEAICWGRGGQSFAVAEFGHVVGHHKDSCGVLVVVPRSNISKDIQMKKKLIISIKQKRI